MSSKRGSSSSIRVLRAAQEQEDDDDTRSVVSMGDLEDLARQFQRGCKVVDRKYHLRVYPKCFVGSQAVDFMVQSKMARNRQEAVELGRDFVRRLNLFEHVCRDHDFKDAYLFYRFIPKKKRFTTIDNMAILEMGNLDTVESNDDDEDYSISSSTTTQTTTGAQGIEDIQESFERGVEVKNRRFHFKLYPEVRS